MSIIKEIHISWGAFKQELYNNLGLSKNMLNSKKFLYRGQGNRDHELVSTFDRIFYHEDYKARKEIEIELINEFKELCDGIINLVNLSENEIIALARHHNLPTKLIDWSLSPYIAAYFAFSSNINQNTSKEIAIFAFDLESNVVSNGIEMIQVANKDNDRQRHQMGYYLKLTSYEKSIENFLINYEKSMGKVKKPILYKFIISADECKEALMDLNLMGINAYNLMEGLDSICYTALSNVLLKRDL